MLTKDKLLPPTADSVREVSLRNHLALAACRSSAGNTALVGELFIVASLSWFLRDAGFGNETDSFHHDVQDALEHCVYLTSSGEAWAIDGDDEAILGRLLCSYDRKRSIEHTGALRAIVGTRHRHCPSRVPEKCSYFIG